MDKDLPLLSIEHLNSLLPVIPADQYPILKNIFIHAPDALLTENCQAIIPKAQLMNGRLYLDGVKEYRNQGRGTTVEWLITGLWYNGKHCGWQQAYNARDGCTEYCYFKDGKRVEYTLQRFTNKQYMKDSQPPYARMITSPRIGFQKVYMVQSRASEEPDEVVFQFGDGYKRIILHGQQLGLTKLMQSEGLPMSLPLLAVLETTDLMAPFTSSVMRVCDDLYITIPQIPQVQLIKKKKDMNRLLRVAAKILPANNSLATKYLMGRELALLSGWIRMK